MTIDRELRDLAIYLKYADSDSAAAVCERARCVINALVESCESWDSGFQEGEEFTAEQFRVWVNHRRRLAREALDTVNS